jgi:hypothetical protein
VTPPALPRGSAGAVRAQSYTTTTPGGTSMTDTDLLVCQWCRQPIPVGTAAWWDDKPQCPDPFACDKRAQSREARR